MDYQALFLDLDDTLIRTKSGSKFPLSTSDWQLIPETIESIKKFRHLNIFIVTNQAGIEAGFWSKGQIEHKLNSISISLSMINIYIKEIIFAVSKDSKYYKPKPAAAFEIAERHKLNLHECLMVGDGSDRINNFSDSDKKFAENAGMQYMDINEFNNKWSKKLKVYSAYKLREI